MHKKKKKDQRTWDSKKPLSPPSVRCPPFRSLPSGWSKSRRLGARAESLKNNAGCFVMETSLATNGESKHWIRTENDDEEDVERPHECRKPVTCHHRLITLGQLAVIVTYPQVSIRAFHTTLLTWFCIDCKRPSQRSYWHTWRIKTEVKLKRDTLKISNTLKQCWATCIPLNQVSSLHLLWLSKRAP